MFLSFSDDIVSLKRSERMAYLATLALVILLFSLDYVLTFKKKNNTSVFWGIKFQFTKEVIY